MSEVNVFLKDLVDESTLESLKANGIDTLALINELISHEHYFCTIVPCMAMRLKIILKLREVDKFLDIETDKSRAHTSQDPSFLEPASENIEPASETIEPASKHYIVEGSSGELVPVPLIESTIKDASDSEDKSDDLEQMLSRPLNKNKAKKQNKVSKKNSANDDETVLDLPGLLYKTATGKAIIGIYKRHKELDSRCQSYLTDIIVEQIINTIPFRRLTNNDFDKLSKQIGKFFPRESPLVYYTPPINKRISKDKKSVIARGKLVDKYRNKLSFLRKAGSIPSQLLDDESEEELSDHVYDENNDILWLKHNRDPWDDVQLKWTKTFGHRSMLIRNRKNELKDILNEYPIISHDLGYILIDLDFQRRFQIIHGNIFSTFETVFFTLLEIRKKNLNPTDNLIVKLIYESDEEIDKNPRHLLMINMLTTLLPSKSYNKKLINNWHPTLNDTKEGIIVEIKASTDLAEVIEDRRILLRKHGLPMLPFLIVESPTFSEVKSIYVSFDKILYSVVSIVKGLDVCFQLFQVFNLVYPYQSEHIWMFIQRAMYNYKTKLDNIPNILDITNKIENKLNN